MRKCNYFIKLKIDDNIKIFPAIVETKVLDIYSDNYITLPVGKIIVTLQNILDTYNIMINQRFLVMDKPWLVAGVDKLKIGLLVLKCDLDLLTDNNDKFNQIAGTLSNYDSWW